MNHIFYNSNFNHPSSQFDTFAKSKILAERLAAGGHRVTDPDPYRETTETIIGEIHTPDYVDAIRTGLPSTPAASNGFTWVSGVYDTVVAHNSGVVAAVAAAHFGDRNAVALSSGLHHAKPERGEGFCTFNGLAVAASYAVHHLGIRVAIVDVDAHCGGGTVACLDRVGLFNDAQVAHFDVSTNAYDTYDDSSYGPNATLDVALRSRRRQGRLDSVADAATFQRDYIALAKEAFQRAVDSGADLIIYNAGVDPLDNGIDEATLNRRDQLAAAKFAAAGKPVAITMAGGYSRSNPVTAETVYRAHLATVKAFS